MITSLTENNHSSHHTTSKTPPKAKAPSNQRVRTHPTHERNHTNIQVRLNNFKLKAVMRIKVTVKMNRSVILRVFKGYYNPLKNYVTISKITIKNYYEKIKISNKTSRKIIYITDHHCLFLYLMLNYIDFLRHHFRDLKPRIDIYLYNLYDK